MILVILAGYNSLFAFFSYKTKPDEASINTADSEVRDPVYLGHLKLLIVSSAVSAVESREEIWDCSCGIVVAYDVEFPIVESRRTAIRTVVRILFIILYFPLFI